MKELAIFLIEKLHINKETKCSNDYYDNLKDILEHFEFNNLYEIDKGRLQKEPYITKEEGEDIISKLEDFLIENNANKDNFEYYCSTASTYKNLKGFIKDNSKVMNLNNKLHSANDNKRIFKKNSLYFEISSQEKLIGMYGPFGGSKICKLNKQ